MMWKNPDRTISKLKKYYTHWYPGKNSVKKKEVTKSICTPWKESNNNACLAKKKKTNKQKKKTARGFLKLNIRVLNTRSRVK